MERLPLFVVPSGYDGPENDHLNTLCSVSWSRFAEGRWDREFLISALSMAKGHMLFEEQIYGDNDQMQRCGTGVSP